MPRHCSVKGCRTTNRTSQSYVPTFKFPNCEVIKLKWVNATSRPNWKPTKYSGICARHFKDEDFTNHPNEPSKRQRVSKYAIPSIFESRSPVKIEQVKKKILNVEPDQPIIINPPDYIGNYEIFASQFKERLDVSKYLIFENIEKVVFYKLQSSNDLGCNISTRICVSKNLYVKVIVQNTEIFSADLELLPRNMKISKWSQISYILNKYREESGEIYENREYLLNRALHYLVKSRDVDSDFQHGGKLDIIINQVDHLNKVRPRYNSETILFAFLIFAHSAATYNVLKKFLILPHASYLKHISSDFNISPDNKSVMNNAEHHLNRDGKTIVTDTEKYVALIIDEIRIEDSLEYKNIDDECKDLNDFNDGVRTIMVFMIKSIFGNYKKIVRLFPVIRPTGETLYELTRTVIQFVQKLDFKVLVIITDKNEITQNMFKQFCPENNFFQNPNFPKLKIFVQYDTIHLFKDIRDSWLKLESLNKTFFYPDFEDYSIKQASFSNFELLEKNLKISSVQVTKPTTKLDRKTLKPTILDRHNITLVENLFHDSTIAALQHNDEMKETADFCIIIKKWWHIVNAKEIPIKSLTDENFLFLQRFLLWLEIWNSSSNNSGSLTTSTMNALKLATQTFINLIQFSFNHCIIDSVLLGKLQTDDLNGRFGLYRLLAGI